MSSKPTTNDCRILSTDERRCYVCGQTLVGEEKHIQKPGEIGCFVNVKHTVVYTTLAE